VPRTRALVTGGGRGIGLAIARRLLAEGHQVHVADVDRPAVDGAVNVQCDVRDSAQVAAAVEGAVAQLGGLDVLVNNAGVESVGAVADLSDSELMRLFDVNVFGVLRCMRAAIPVLTQPGGVIINIASVAGLAGFPMQAAYGASKAAVLRLTETAALELRGLGIRVNAICPALVATPMAADLAGQLSLPAGITFDTLIAAKQGRLAEPEEVAEAVAFLASEEASMITGASYLLDNGMRAGLL
jgi:NAD(P)-dependent dehydrogenase (short-subunit alcohol dehydrogenase family)